MKNNQLQLVTHEQAEQLRIVGFDWPCEEAIHAITGEAFPRVERTLDE
jgi:hypothetical protein